MFKQCLPAARATAVITLLTGLGFPLLIAGFAQVMMPELAHGSLIKNADGQIIGSRLIGQSFARPQYFHPRPSAAGAGYAGEASSGTNLGPTSAKLINGIENTPTNSPTNSVASSFDGIKQLASRYRQENALGQNQDPPVDAVTRSASGLDPDISEANALLQAGRIARTRGVDVNKISAMVKKHTEGRLFGIMGEPYVRVLPLNIALDEAIPMPGKMTAARTH
jgi:K+-transporting ATPase ATPase C chain